MRLSTRIGIVVLLMMILPLASRAQQRERSEIPEKYQWNLADIYPSEESWQAGKEALVKEIPNVEAFKGKVGDSPQQLLDALNTVYGIYKQFTRLYVYAGMSYDQDTRVSKYQAMKQEMAQVGADLSAKAAYIEPEILAMNSSKVASFIGQEKGLAIYRVYLTDLLRRKAHTGTEGEEKIKAQASLIAGTPQDVFTAFLNADFPYPEITLSDGKSVELNQAGFFLNRTLQNRDDRKNVFDAYFGRLNDYRRTIGTQLYGEVKKDMFYARASDYNSSLERALDASNIPTEVYYNLVKNVNANLATFHRYLKLRKRMMGLDTLHYYDLYAPLVQDVDLKYSVEEAEKNILASLKPLGKDYVATVEKALNSRWIDMYPTEGKRSGAYSQGGAYDVHPYMLLNYNGKYNDMSTLAHELGHTMQSYLSNKAQPYPMADYPIFVAEVASTFNEALLIDYMLKQIKDDNTRLSLLGNYLEGIKGTLFRQTQFAEFELRIHELAEKGEALTGDKLNEIYMDITRRYYGHDNNVCYVDSVIQSEWSAIPHFYLNFYVYQYATSFTASAALSEKVLAGDKDEVTRYLAFLSAGGSDYPIELLKKAGVDMTTSQPFELTMKKMNRVMNEMEKILAKQKK